jgi:hypothetical protein
MPKIRIRKELFEHLSTCSEKAGYATVEEFITHVLEKAAAEIAPADADEEAVRKRLQGLGYLE